MTVQSTKDFNAGTGLSATSKDALSKLVKAWEAKNNERTKRAAGLGLMAVSLAACGGGEDAANTIRSLDDPDGDGFQNTIDAFPNDGTEWLDTDGDGFGDNSDRYPTAFNLPNGSIPLSAGVDTISVAAGNASAGNDVYTANDFGFTALDSIDGGAGADTLNITQVAAFAIPAGTSVANIETVNIRSAATVTADVSGWSGLTTLNLAAIGDLDATAAATVDIRGTVTAVAANGITGNGGDDVTLTASGIDLGTITVGGTTAAAGNVVINATGTAGASTIGVITVTGGDTVIVNQTASNAVGTTLTLGDVTVNGDAGTTSVAVNQAAAAAAAAAVVGVSLGGAVLITDAVAAAGVADTISTVTLANFDASTITTSALGTLNLTGGTTAALASGALTLTAQSLTGGATTLALNSAGGFIGAIGGTQADAYTTINVNSSAATTFADLNAAAVQTLNFTGAGNTTFTAFQVGQLGGLLDINVTGTGGVTLGRLAADELDDGTDFDGGAGNDSIFINGNATVGYTMGAGNDTVTIVTAIGNDGMGVGGSLAGGIGTDTIVMVAADAVLASTTAAFNADVSGFETLQLSTAAANNAIVDVDALNDVSRVELAAAPAGAAFTIANLNSGGTISLAAAAVNAANVITVAVQSAIAGLTDVLNIELNNAAATNFGVIAAANVETINIDANDATAAGGAAVVHTLSLAGTASATTIDVDGNNGLTLAGNAATVTRFDASGVVGNDVLDTAAGLAVTFTSANATVADTVTIIGGAGDDALTGNAARDVISGGAGSDVIDGKAGIDTLTGGAGRDVFVFVAGQSSLANPDVVTDFTLSGALTAAQANANSVVTFRADADYGNADVLDLDGGAGGNAGAVLVEANATGNGQAAGVTFTVTNGILTLSGAGAAAVDTIGEWIAEATAAANDGNAVAFQFGGDTYVFVDGGAVGGNAVADTLVLLDNVTGVSALATFSATDVLANSILIA